MTGASPNPDNPIEGTQLRILITGITGRVGANVAQRFVELGHDVTGFVWPGDRQSDKVAQIGADVVEGDLASSADVTRAADGAEAIFHLGAAFQAGGPFTPEQYFDINVKGTFNVLEAASASDRLQHVIVTSTDATMDKYPPEGIEEPIREDSLPLVATHWYGYTKVLTEHLVDRYVRSESLPATVFRFANAWGAGEALDYPQFHMRTFMDQLANATDDEGRKAYEIMSAAYDSEPHLIIASDRNGRPWKKHFVEVRDIIHAYENALANPATFGKTYQIASGEPFRWDVMIPFIAQRLNAPYTKIDLPITPSYYEYDISAAQRDFDYDPPQSLFEVIDEAINHRNTGSGSMIPTTL